MLLLQVTGCAGQSSAAVHVHLRLTRDHSIVAAEIMQSISKHASDRFNSVAADLIPFVFIGKHDSNETVKELFQDTWNDNVGGSRAVSLYLQEILAMSTEHLDSPQWAVKHTAARSIADATVAVASIGSEMDAASAGSLWPALEKALGGKTWEGKEVVLYAFVKLVETGRKLWSAQHSVAQAIEKVRAPLQCLSHQSCETPRGEYDSKRP